MRDVWKADKSRMVVCDIVCIEHNVHITEIPTQTHIVHNYIIPSKVLMVCGLKLQWHIEKLTLWCCNTARLSGNKTTMYLHSGNVYYRNKCDTK